MEIERIIEELKNHNNEHFNVFYDMTKRQVYFSAITILKSHENALDIVQDTYISFLNHIDSFDKRKNVYAYLSVISRNLSINLYNRNKKVINDNEFIDLHGSDNEDPYMESRIKAILDLLDNELEKEIVVYHAIWDYKFKDIATIVDKPLGTVIWLYNKAMKILKERIEKNEK